MSSIPTSFVGRRVGWMLTAVASVLWMNPGRAEPVSVPVDAVTSQDGQHAVWMKTDGSGFWIAERLTVGAEWRVPKELTIRGIVGHPVLSPDGRSFAFQNARGGYTTQDPDYWGPNRAYTWSYIAVYDFAHERISFVNPSFSEDSDPRWSGNDTIAYTRRIEGLPDVTLTSPVTSPLAPAASASLEKEKALLIALLETPLLYQPAASADGGAMAFATRAGRERAIYFMRLGETAQPVVRYDDDDGQVLSQLALSADGNLIAYVRGGDPNNKGEIPNPRTLSEPPKQQVWLLDTRNPGPPRPVGVGFSPQFSPDGSRLVWQTERGLASLPLRAREGSLQVSGSIEYLFPGPLTTLRFTPDGQHIAYERSSYIEIYDLSTHARWAIAKPRDAVDADPVWSPDGQELAFRREWAPQALMAAGYSGEFVSKHPWTIHVANVQTHQAREVWHAEEGVGSTYYPLNQDPTDTGAQGDQLFWSDRHEIGFVWERDSWKRLYGVPLQGGATRLLTPGDGEVEQAAVSMDHKYLIYSSNFGDLERRHVARVAFAGGAPQPLASGGVSQWGPTALANDQIAFIEGGWNTPERVMLQNGGTTSAVVGAPAVSTAFPAAQMVEPQPVTFPGADGQRAYGQLFVPARPSGCGIVFVHGGIRRQMLLGFHYLDAYSNLYELNQYFAMRGCVVLSVEYRSSIMRGYAFRNPPGWGNAGASEYQDVLGGARYLQSRRDLGVRHVGIYGLSWGGYLAAQALGRNSDVFEVGFDMSGLHEFPGETFQYSPPAFAAQWRSPMYLAAGDDDRNVNYSQAIMLIRTLQQQAPDVQLVTKAIPDETHELALTFENLVTVYSQGSDFVLNHLQPARSH